MGAAFFYHLTERPLEATLPVLLGKALEAGWRVEVRGTDDAALDRLDRQLWLGEGFLPHGRAGGPRDAEQPVLLTNGPGGNDAACVMSVDGAEVAPKEVAGLERVCILFNGADAGAVEVARNQWRAMTEAGVSAQYWAEDGGRWVKKSESG
ncbi:MAG: DNA polymerase III subunit chi [Paracoccaceae bacterium]|nr:DNA polymerase III subunit chi [Paracoccaceae bacterium]